MIKVGKERFAGRRPPSSQDADRAAAWQTMLKTWPNYAKYEERTDRLIPVFRLTRRDTQPDR